MPVPVPVAARVVEVIGDLGPQAADRYRYGSGCLVGGRWVLTAAHVVAGAVSAKVRDPAKRTYTATVDPAFVGDVDGPHPDLALVEIVDSGFRGDLPPIDVAAVDRDNPNGEPVERVHAIGYPWFAETPSPDAVRETVDALGIVPVASGLARGLLSVVVSVAPQALPPEGKRLADSEWSGMSGAPVLAAGRLLGVVTEYAPRAGPSTVMAVPLTALQCDDYHKEWGPGLVDSALWLERLGVGDPAEWPRLPPRPPERPKPAYRDSLLEYGRTLHARMPQLLGRQHELVDIASFAMGTDGYRWLVGGAYAGKSALMYEAVTVGLPDQVDVVSYFLSRRASDASSERFLAATVSQLAYLCEVATPPATRDEFLRLWRMAAEQAEQAGRHLLLVVDGLDEDLRPPGSPSVASLLPALVGGHAHVHVTSRPKPEVPGDVPGGHPLRQVQPVDLEPFLGAEGLAELARQEIDDLIHGPDSDLAVDVLGTLTAAAGPLTMQDLATLSNGLTPPPAAHTRHVRRMVSERAARSLEPVGSPDNPRYQFAHLSLLEYAESNEDLADSSYRNALYEWAQSWRDAGWTAVANSRGGVPRYLLDEYPATLASDLDRLAALAGHPSWVAAAIPVTGVDPVLAALRIATAARPDHSALASMLSIVSEQRLNLLPPRPVDQAGYVLRQLCLEALEHGENTVVDALRDQLLDLPDPGPIPLWTSHRASPALAVELGEHAVGVGVVAVLGDGRVVTGSRWDRRVMVWDPARPDATPIALSDHAGPVRAVAVLGDGRVVTGGNDGRMLVWDPSDPGTGPALPEKRVGSVRAVAVLDDGRIVIGTADGGVLVWDPRDGDPAAATPMLGQHGGAVGAVAVLGDGRVVTGGRKDGRVQVWDPADSGAEPAELGQHAGGVGAVAVLADGRVVSSSESDRRVLMWDPADSGAGPAELGQHAGGVAAVAVLADGRVVTGGMDGQVVVWDPADSGDGPVVLGEHAFGVGAVAVLPDGRVVTGGMDGRLLVWNPADPGVGSAGASEDGGLLEAVAVLADGRVVTGGMDGRVQVWDPADSGAEPTVHGQHAGGVGAGAVLADGRVVTGGIDGRVVVWDPADSGAPPAELGTHAFGVGAVAVLPDGRVVTGGMDGQVVVWDPADPGAGPVLLGTQALGVGAVAVLPDGRVVTGSWEDSRVLVWDPADSGAGPVVLGQHAFGVGAVAVLADGRVVTGSRGDGRVLVWDPTQPLADAAELGKHALGVPAVAVLGDGRVVSGGWDRRVLMWDPAGKTKTTEIGCSAVALGVSKSSNASGSRLAMAHAESGWSLWLV
ncbi:trypsin-like serine protease [Modestobacter marinus]|uniref:trypsin-like serine protease n=1 Tax=Modestobacter marinus TaxID=477641 RepID=UPI001C93E771|nr:trypsin-like serine protease [Modestobacter marinus]